MRAAPKIVRDQRNYHKVVMKRNHPFMVQSSMDAVRSWRANCDVQVLIYTSNPDDPDPAEIAKVTDYIVGYACKGGKRLKEEKKLVKELIEEYIQLYPFS